MLSELRLESLPAGGRIDTEADEELMRRVGREAASAVLVKRWEEADQVTRTECSDCGKEMSKLGLRSRDLQTICGTIRIERKVFYCARCEKTEAPLDKRLNVDEGGMTSGIRRLLCRTALEIPYQQSENLLKDILGFRPCSARQIERIVKEHGEHLERLQSEPKGKSQVSKQKEKSLYCLAIDAAMIPGLPDKLEHQIKWHDAKIATIYDPGEIREPIYIAGREDAQKFGLRLHNNLRKRHLDEGAIRSILGDGAPWIWNIADTYLPGVAQLLDFYHASEHLYATAKAIWTDKTDHHWWQSRLQQLKEGKIDNFFEALKRLTRTHNTDDANISPKRLLQYFEENRSRLIYRWAIDHNLPIGSGAVESAARHIVQQRLKLSGMRWSDSGAQAILNLRTLHRNGDFEQYCEDYAKNAA